MSVGRILAAVAAALLAAIAIWRRRRLGAERTGLALIAAAGLAVYASGLLSLLPNPEHVIADVAKALGPWTYALVGGLAFLETGAFVGLVAPGETVVIVGGVIAGQGEIEIVPLIGLVWLCAILGDTTSFFIGRRLGREFMLRHGPRLKITPERLERVEGYFQRHGGKTILIGRFVGLVRALAPFIAGSSRMSYGSFIPYSVIGTGLWAALFSLLGFIFYRSFERVSAIAGRATLGLAIVVGVVAAAVYAYRRLRHEEERRRLARWLERQADRPLLRPVASLVRPLWRRLLAPVGRLAAPRLRFLWERLTPGELGIELTTALAAMAVGLYVFALYAVVLSDDAGTTPADQELLDLTAELRAAAAVDVLSVVTELGALPTVAAFVLVCSVALTARGHANELAALLVGAILVYVGVQLAKAGIDRPRPPAPAIETSGSAYPSGHAAYSTAYVAMAVIGARLVPGLARGAGLVVVAVAVSAGIGLSRVYLHAHYWSDVAGGWALGFGIFGGCAAVALIVAHMRHNGPGVPVAAGREADEPPAATDASPSESATPAIER